MLNIGGGGIGPISDTGIGGSGNSTRENGNECAPLAVAEDELLLEVIVLLLLE